MPSIATDVDVLARALVAVHAGGMLDPAGDLEPFAERLAGGEVEERIGGMSPPQIPVELAVSACLFTPLPNRSRKGLNSSEVFSAPLPQAMVRLATRPDG